MAASRPRESIDHGPEWVGRRLRAERERQGVGLRELARRVNVSASLVSQVELGKAAPSVGTLYAIVNELGLSLDQLFFEAASGERSTTPMAAAAQGNGGAMAEPVDSVGSDRAPSAEPARVDFDRPDRPSYGEPTPVVRPADRKRIQLDSGVTWHQLTAVTDQDVEFLYVSYDVGGASCQPDTLIRHAGKEYGYVIAGRLGVTVGFETYELGPEDAISFVSTQPHRLFNLGDVPTEAIWLVTGRRSDASDLHRRQSH
jgi:transcriptional regulator with XRE-family HTH domain/mannose-6-phosphate isomerase-like protein (cupin superfamily)